MTEWHPEPDELVALALTQVGPDDEERLVAHLASCAACRDEYAGLSDGVQQTLAASPAVAPPAGFSGRVLDAMAGEAAPAVRPRRTSRLLAAAAVLVGLLVGVGGTLAATAWLDRPQTTTSHAPVATPLLAADGTEVGSAGLATLAGHSYLVLNITAGKPGVSYECVLVGADGTRTSGGTWTLTDEYGTGHASGSWLVPVTGDAPAAVELVGPSGAVWSQGTF